MALEKLVLDDIRGVTTFAKDYEDEFAALVGRQAKMAEESALRDAQLEHDRAAARSAEIDRIIRGLYEDRIKGILPVERFTDWQTEYDTEQKGLTERLAKLNSTLNNESEKAARADKFLALVRKYTDITKLTNELVATFVSRIIVGLLERIDGKKQQTVRIVYYLVGELDHLS